MPSRHDPTDSLADIVENARRAAEYIAGMDRDAFASDGRTRDAVERCLERVCEAAFRLREQATELIPSQPWADIRGLGNQLRHAYNRINLETVWNTASVRLPSLRADAERVLERLAAERNERS